MLPRKQCLNILSFWHQFSDISPSTSQYRTFLQQSTSTEFSSPVYVGVNFESLIWQSVYNITFQSPSSHSNSHYPLSCLSLLQNKVILTCRSNKKYNVFSLICIVTDYPFVLYNDLYSKGRSMLSCKASLKEQILRPRLPWFIYKVLLFRKWAFWQ